MTVRRLLASILIVLALASAAAIAEQSAQRPPVQPQDEFVPLSELPADERLPSAPLLVAAYAFVWLAVGGYVVSVARRLTNVQKEVERLEADVKRGSRA
jgi:CcmD family protein